MTEPRPAYATDADARAAEMSGLELQPQCGHPVACIVGSGCTRYCVWCASLEAARADERRRCDDMTRRNKYGNRKVFLYGFHFDSQAEANRYGELRLLEQAGEITDLVVHPRYLLQEGFTNAEGRRVYPIHYIADFEYIEDGKRIVEDVKGHQTAVFRLKRKLFEYRYQDMEFRVVEA
jgi:hypothetical protein